VSDDIDNAQTILDAGSRIAGASARVTWLAHPNDEHVKVPVALNEYEGNAQLQILRDVLETLDARCTGPTRRTGTLTLHEVETYIEALKRWGSKDTIVYANVPAMGFVAVLDDHPAGSGAAWRQYRATYTCPRSPQWKAWTERDGQPMSQSAFGDFVEEHLEDLIATGADGKPIAGAPQPLDVLMLARRLMINTKGVYQREIDVTTGDNILVCKIETDPATSTKIPRAFWIAIPVFEGGDRYQIEVRPRFALTEDGKRPMFSFGLHRRPEIERDAFGAVRKLIADATGFPMYAGVP